jgi:HAD superfamily hydrolase (TIGR01484 family)
MKPLNTAPSDTFSSVRFLLTDMDETLTFQGRLAAETYQALERLQSGGVIVIPVTAAPAGWCDQMARMWPVDGVIGENGGLFIQRSGHSATRTFWSAEPEADRERLVQAAGQVKTRIPAAALAEDQDFRLSTLAFQASQRAEQNAAIEAALRDFGLEATQNNLWVLGWAAKFDKLKMARRVLSGAYGLDIDRDGDAVIYVGDSANDAPMFSFFRHTVGVSTVRRYLHDIPDAPAWITHGPGGAGFVEVANAVLNAISAQAPLRAS